MKPKKLEVTILFAEKNMVAHILTHKMEKFPISMRP